MNKPTEYWLWWVTDEVTGKPRRTAYRITRHEALSRLLDAEPLAGSMEIPEPARNVRRAGPLERMVVGR